MTTSVAVGPGAAAAPGACGELAGRLSARGIWLFWMTTRIFCVAAVLTSPFASGRLGTLGLAGDVGATYGRARAALEAGLLLP